MNIVGIAMLCAFAAATAPCASAASISNISFLNNSGADTLLVEPGETFKEFRTVAETPLAASQNGAVSTFTNRMAWFLGHRVTEAGASYPQLFSRVVAYDLLFQVDDPGGFGYTLDFESVFRGVLTASHEGNDSLFTPFVFTSGTLMAANLSVDGATPLAVTSLATDIDVATANATNPLVEEQLDLAKAYSAGTFFGTHVFRLAYVSNVSNATSGLQNFNWGEATVRFGLSAQETAFLHGGYPASDGAEERDHGHFLNVRVTSLDQTAEVPEPASVSMAAAGLCLALLGALRRRSQAGSSRA
ncbi:MAG: hypothetical protein U5J83_04240 [Bryobacterales bacterium]|nr:hypothetical protein [Bryobacterales bacterium]